jgi:hypothetical protein
MGVGMGMGKGREERGGVQNPGLLEISHDGATVILLVIPAMPMIPVPGVCSVLHLAIPGIFGGGQPRCGVERSGGEVR